MTNAAGQSSSVDDCDDLKILPPLSPAFATHQPEMAEEPHHLASGRSKTHKDREPSKAKPHHPLVDSLNFVPKLVKVAILHDVWHAVKWRSVILPRTEEGGRLALMGSLSFMEACRESRLVAYESTWVIVVIQRLVGTLLRGARQRRLDHWGSRRWPDAAW